MARVALCDRCGKIIKDYIIKQVSFASNPCYKAVVYDVCDKCYDELKKCMEINMGKDNDSKL